VAANIRSLAGRAVNLAGVAGKDPAGQQLCQLLQSWGITSWLDDKAPRTTVKTRVVVGGYQVLRVDIEEPFTSQALSNVVVSYLRDTPQLSAVVVADYNKGAMNALLVDLIRQWAQYRKIPMLVDAKPARVEDYTDVDVLKINLAEALAVCDRIAYLHPGLGLGGLAAGEVAAAAIRRQFNMGLVVVTCGRDGAAYATPHGVGNVPQKLEVLRGDVTGAGDVFMAGLVTSYLEGCSIPDACSFATLAATASVRKIGTAVMNRDDIDAELLLARGWVAKIMGLERVVDVVQRQRAHQRRIVLTNGCFDALHAGHINMLMFAKAQGDFLVAACNDDASVRACKGEHRPFVDSAHRSAQLAMQAVCDAVVIFDGNVETLVRRLNPDVLIKGEEYRCTVVPGADWVASRGGRLVFAPMLGNVHTTLIREQP
jgi:D-beta-D-heptose 7-phosphate kinase/D-beta-D-heptose 1-phosphate adenosyltransferase